MGRGGRFSPITPTCILYLYEEGTEVHRFLWPMRELLWRRRELGGDHRELDRTWWEWNRFLTHRFRAPLSIAFAFVATHNHFVLDRGGKVFKRSAPIIKLPHGAAEDDHLDLLGLVNSSTACFWMKPIFHNKGSTVDDRGARQTTVAFENFYEFTGTGLLKFPVAQEKPLALASKLDCLAQERQKHLPAQLASHLPLPRTTLDEHRDTAAVLLRTMIALQEELDWSCYRLYGISDEDLCCRDNEGKQFEPPGIELGQRAFEILMTRKMAAGQLETTWFERHRSTPVTEVPDHWPDEYKRLIGHRIAAIESNQYIGLMERPEYKRRWNTEPWEEQEKRTLRNWLLDRLEDERYWPELSLQTTRTLANRAHTDADFMQVAELYRGHAGFDVHTLVGELVASESVPFLPVLRYKASGLRKRDIWERTWVQQRREDAIDADVAAALHPWANESAADFQERLKAEQRRRKQEEIGNIPPHPSTRPPISRAAPIGGCVARPTCRKSVSSAIPSVRLTLTRRLSSPGLAGTTCIRRERLQPGTLNWGNARAGLRSVCGPHWWDWRSLFPGSSSGITISIPNSTNAWVISSKASCRDSFNNMG
jgi:hypothetical protein